MGIWLHNTHSFELTREPTERSEKILKTIWHEQEIASSGDIWKRQPECTPCLHKHATMDSQHAKEVQNMCNKMGFL